LDYGLKVKELHETPLNIQCPAGLVRAVVETHEGVTGAVRFERVPAFAYKLGQFIETREYGPVEIDIGYGGAVYARLNAATLGLDVKRPSGDELTAAAAIVTEAAKPQIPITHTEAAD